MKHFSLSEFDSPDSPGSGAKMDPGFLVMLDQAREIAGIPFKVNSGFRTPERNRTVGGKANSAHTKGKAADISTNTGAQRFAIVRAAMQAGFERIGIGRTFVHLDNDDGLPSPCVWTY